MSVVSVTNVTVDVSGVVRDINNVINDEYTRTLIHAHLAQIVYPYVPYDTGYLSEDSVEIEPDGVVYTADYAWRQYYGTEFNHKRDVHPLATAFWDKVAMETHYDEFAQDIVNIIAERYNNG
jgi:hypothetical protein